MKQARRLAALAATFFLLAGCSGLSRSSGGGLLPATSQGAAAALGPARALERDGRKKSKVAVRITIPRRRRDAARLAHPATISAGTKSVAIAINGGTAQLFNVTPGSPNCTSGLSGTTCTLSVVASVGTDTFTVSTYSDVGGGGAILDQSAPATIHVALAQANALSIHLSPVVSTTADSGPGSLRYAIANANSGDTILFLIPAKSTITLSTPITLRNVTVAGPGFTSTGPGNYQGIVTSGNGAQQIFTVPNGVTATISGLVLWDGRANVANTPGGAIANAGTLTLLNDALVDNTSLVEAQPPPAGCGLYAEGGAVYNSGALTVTGSTFDSNLVPSNVFTGQCSWGRGGAIYNDGALTITTSTFTNNTAYEGGAVYNNASTETAQFSNDSFTANLGCNNAAAGCATTGCGGSGCTSYGTGLGAAIYDGAGPGISVTSSSFSNNVVGGGNGAANTTSSGYGGALYLATGTPHVSSTSFAGNAAGGGTTNCSLGDGGAIYATVPVEIDNDNFSNNGAAGDYGAQGGAIAEVGGALSGSGNAFSYNTATGYGGTTCAPSAAAGGGAIQSSYPVTLANTTFTNNAADGTSDAYGGALYSSAATTLAGDIFGENSSLANGLNGASSTAYGGAIFATAALTLSQDTITSNDASAQGSAAQGVEGGAVYGSATVTAASTSFTTNEAIVPEASTATAYGGALFTVGALGSTSNAFSGNVASGGSEADGGALYTSAKITSNGDSFTTNNADAAIGSGGALYAAGTGTITNSSFGQNSASTTANTGVGGAIVDSGGLSIYSSTIISNQAATAGGGVYVAQSDIIVGSEIASNTVVSAPAFLGGGGIYIANGGTGMSSNTIANNRVTLSGAADVSGGGGIYVGGSGMSMYQSVVDNNSVAGSGASSNGGGAILFSVTGAVINSTLYNNNSSVNGGGAFIHTSGTAELIGDTLYQNSATANGGNVDEPQGTLVFANSILAGGSAAALEGPDLNTAGGSLTDDDYNLIQYGVTGNGLAGVHDITGKDPNLGGLADNGGLTYTLGDSSSSPGYDYIPSGVNGSNDPYCGNAIGTVIIVDQRGYTRGGDGFCDIGAFESGATAAPVRQTLVRPKPATHPDPHVKHRRPPHARTFNLHPKRRINHA
jgi:hypothetical protein